LLLGTKEFKFVAEDNNLATLVSEVSSTDLPKVITGPIN
jgi:hypothetical protein